jgi:hypothetical protein
MNSKNKALVNYYVRLIQKETYTIDDIPLEHQEKVKEILEASKEIEEEKEEKSE